MGEKTGQNSLLTPFLICAAAAFLRFLFLGRQSMDLDESFSLWVASHPLKLMIQILAYDAHPPLFYTFLHFWSQLGKSAFLLRAPFAFLGVINVFLVYLLAREWFGKFMAAVASLLWASSFLVLEMETWTRMYTPAAVFSLAATLVFWKAFKQPSVKKWLAYLTLATLSLYTHYYTGFVILAHWLFLLWKKQWREASWIPIVLAAAFLPWTPVFFFQFSNGASTLMPFHGWVYLAYVPPVMLWPVKFFRIVSVFWAMAALSIGIFLAGAYFLLKEKKDENFFLVLLFTAPCLIPFLITETTGRHIFASRYFIFFAPYFYLIFLFGLFKLRRSISIPVFAAVLLVNLVVWRWFLVAPSYQRQDWKDATQAIQSRIKPGDALFVEQTASLFPLSYYLPRELSIKWEDSALLPTSTAGVRWSAVHGKSSLPFVQEALRYSRRQWLIMCEATEDDPDFFLFQWLKTHRKLEFYRINRSIDADDNIYLFLFTSPASSERSKTEPGLAGH